MWGFIIFIIFIEIIIELLSFKNKKEFFYFLISRMPFFIISLIFRCYSKEIHSGDSMVICRASDQPISFNSTESSIFRPILPRPDYLRYNLDGYAVTLTQDNWRYFKNHHIQSLKLDRPELPLLLQSQKEISFTLGQISEQLSTHNIISDPNKKMH
jgi:hypothetical protein